MKIFLTLKNQAHSVIGCPKSAQVNIFHISRHISYNIKSVQTYIQF